MKSHLLCGFLLIVGCLFLLACDLNPFSSSSDDNTVTADSSLGGFTVAEMQQFVAALNDQRALKMAPQLTVPAYSFYRFDFDNTKGARRLSSILSYDEAASATTIGILNTSKVMIFDTMVVRAGYNLDYFSFIDSVPAATIYMVASYAVEQMQDIEFLLRSTMPLASGPILAPVLKSVVDALPLPPPADFRALPVSKRDLVVSPSLQFPSLNSLFVARVAFSEEFQNFSNEMVKNKLANLQYFHANVDKLPPPDMSLHSMKAQGKLRATASAYNPEKFPYLDFYLEESSGTVNSNQEFGIALYNASGSISAQIATFPQNLPVSATVRQIGANRELSMNWSDEIGLQAFWKGVLTFQIIKRDYRNFNGACACLQENYDWRSNGTKDFPLLEQFGSASPSLIICDITVDGNVVSTFSLQRSVPLTRTEAIPFGVVATVSFYLLPPWSETETALLASQTIDALILQGLNPPDSVSGDLKEDEDMAFLNAGLDFHEVGNWITVFGHPVAPRTLENLASFTTTRLLVGELPFNAAGIENAPAAPTVSGIISGTFNTTQTFTVTPAEAGGSLQYSLDNGTTWLSYTGSVSIATEGSSIVTARQTGSTGLIGVSAPGITIVIDKTAPAWNTGYPVIGIVGPSNGQIGYSAAEAASASFVVLTSGATAPTAAQVAAGKDSTDAAAIASGKVALAANTVASASFGGLSFGVTYDIYSVISDSHDNLSAPAKLSFTTTSNFVKIKSSADWSARGRLTSVSFNGKIWIIGGGDGAGSPVCSNDAWSSTDGVTWAEATSGSVDRFSAREAHGVAGYNSKLWVVGGRADSTGGFLHDIWSSADGKTWTQNSAAASFSARNNHVVIAYQPAGGTEKLYLLGGYDNAFKNDVYSSTDGITWTSLENAGWAGREAFACAVFNGKLYVMGGYNGSVLSDVWTYDGNFWTQLSGVPGWAPRKGFKACVYDNKMWVFGGSDSSGTILSDLWYTSDGETWTQKTTSISPARTDYGFVSNGLHLFLMGGLGTGVQYNDVWSF